jgi:hypothetical protein
VRKKFTDILKVPAAASIITALIALMMGNGQQTDNRVSFLKQLSCYLAVPCTDQAMLSAFLYSTRELS